MMLARTLRWCFCFLIALSPHSFDSLEHLSSGLYHDGRSQLRQCWARSRAWCNLAVSLAAMWLATGSSTMDFAVCLCRLWLTWISWRTWKICLSCTECSRVRITVSNVAGEQIRMWPSLSRSRYISNGPFIFSCKNVLQKH